MASREYTEKVLENFVFDCMDKCEIKYMPSARELGAFDYDKYCALQRNGGVKYWKERLKLQDKDEYEMMLRRKKLNGQKSSVKYKS